uniref:Uncharacterized protein n=1 Tax=Plectus sambesii TaxID=2011161 RepID=A0A914VGT4_9BILA
MSSISTLSTVGASEAVTSTIDSSTTTSNPPSATSSTVATSDITSTNPASATSEPTSSSTNAPESSTNGGGTTQTHSTTTETGSQTSSSSETAFTTPSPTETGSSTILSTSSSATIPASDSTVSSSVATSSTEYVSSISTSPSTTAPGAESTITDTTEQSVSSSASSVQSSSNSSPVSPTETTSRNDQSSTAAGGSTTTSSQAVSNTSQSASLTTTISSVPSSTESETLAQSTSTVPDSETSSGSPTTTANTDGSGTSSTTTSDQEASTASQNSSTGTTFQSSSSSSTATGAISSTIASASSPLLTSSTATVTSPSTLQTDTQSYSQSSTPIASSSSSLASLTQGSTTSGGLDLTTVAQTSKTFSTNGPASTVASTPTSTTDASCKWLDDSYSGAAYTYELCKNLTAIICFESCGAASTNLAEGPICINVSTSTDRSDVVQYYYNCFQNLLCPTPSSGNAQDRSVYTDCLKSSTDACPEYTEEKYHIASFCDYVNSRRTTTASVQSTTSQVVGITDPSSTVVSTSTITGVGGGASSLTNGMTQSTPAMTTNQTATGVGEAITTSINTPSESGTPQPVTVTPTGAHPSTTASSIAGSSSTLSATSANTPQTTVKQMTSFQTTAPSGASSSTSTSSVRPSVTSTVSPQSSGGTNGPTDTSVQPAATTTTSSNTVAGTPATTSTFTTTESAASTTTTNAEADQSTSTTAATTTVLPRPTLPYNFNISDLTPEQIEQLKNISNQYGLNETDNELTVNGKVQQALHEIAAGMTPEELKAAGYSLKELLQSCAIDSQPCNYDTDFGNLFDPDYGNCYVFNYQAKYKSTKAGIEKGLRMVVMSNISEYMFSSASAGIKVVVHSQSQDPFPNTEGYSAGVGRQASFTIKQRKVHRLDAPYGDCETKQEVEDSNQAFYYSGDYSIEACLRSCFQRKVVAACQCFDPRFPYTGADSTICSTGNAVQSNCYNDFITKNGDYNNVENCSCHAACDEESFDAVVTVAKWPQSPFFYGISCTSAIEKQWNKTCPELYSDNAVLVEVYYSRLGFESLKEEPVMKRDNFFYNLAGTAGLWLGVSFCTLAEFILVFSQALVWLTTKNKEIPDVPSARHYEKESANTPGSVQLARRAASVRMTNQLIYTDGEDVMRRASRISKAELAAQTYVIPRVASRSIDGTILYNLE